LVRFRSSCRLVYFAVRLSGSALGDYWDFSKLVERVLHRTDRRRQIVNDEFGLEPNDPIASTHELSISPRIRGDAASARLIVEVEGGYHERRVIADARRDRKLTRASDRIVRG
jgi:hypothetical protein